MTRRLTIAFSSLMLTLFLAGIAQAEEIVVGGKNFTEQRILSNMTSQYLEHLGYDIDKREGMGTTVLRQAQLNGQIDLYWEYTGTSLISYNKVTEKLSPTKTYERVKKLDAEKGLIWLEPSDANNTYALAMLEDNAHKHDIESISDLAETMNDGVKLTLASNSTFYARDDGLRPLQKTYGFRFGRPNVKQMDQGLTLRALTQGEVDVAMTTATNGQIPALPVVVLDDDRDFFPNYALTPVVRQDTLGAHPELAEQMNRISALLDDEVMAKLNSRVDIDKESVEAVARSFLTQHKLL